MAKNDLPKVSIVVPIFNNETTILKCIRGCLNQKYAGDIEVIIVDDGSTDQSAEIIKSQPVKYLHQKNQGPATARNNGWRNAVGEIICFTDADCIPQPGWVDSLVKNFCDEQIGGTGGTYGIANPESWLANCVHEEIIARHAMFPKFVNFLGSFNAAYRISVLKEVGGFDESYKLASGEDNDLSYRIHGQGYKLVFDPNALVLHHHPENIFRYLKSQFRHGIWRVKLYKCHKNMMFGDAYSNWIDHLQPPLALLAIGLFPFLWIPILYKIFLVLVCAEFALQISVTRRMIKQTGKLKYGLFALVTFLRAFARGLGFLNGLIKFGF